MSDLKRKRKEEIVNRRFSEAWTLKYSFVEKNNRATCLICNFTVAVCKEYNVKRHYEAKHSTFSRFEGKERERKIELLNLG